MALSCSRLLRRNIRRHMAVANRLYAEKNEIKDPVEAQTDLEKQEIMQLKASYDDPFRMRAMKRYPSTKNSPTIIESYYDCRIIGCVCEEDSSSIVWMWIFKGKPKRCMCGHWFKLVEYKA